MMCYKKYIASTVKEACENMSKELGPDSFIIDIKVFEKSYFGGFKKKKWVEVQAGGVWPVGMNLLKVPLL